MKTILAEIKNIDCSPTKKYTKWLVKQYNTEVFDISNIKSYVEEYDALTKRDLINSDIYSFKSLNDFIKTIDDINSVTTASRKDLEDAYDIIIDDEELLLIRPQTHEASRKLGLSVFKHRYNKEKDSYDSAWCTTYATNTHWNSYFLDNKMTFYYGKYKKLTSDNNMCVFACAVDKNGNITVYDANDSVANTSSVTIANHNINDVLIPHNIDKRYEIQQKNMLILLNQEVIDGELILKPNSLKTFDVKIKCKRINGNVRLTDFNEIPAFFHDIYINGDFICSKNRLTSLKGSPKEVAGKFICDDNQLMSLEGAPLNVMGDFECSDNKIKSLKGIQKVIHGNFNASNNLLKNLKYMPYVEKNISLYNNALISLKGIQSIINGDLSCNQNNIRKMDGNIKLINGSFYIDQNELTTLRGCPETINGDLTCSYNKLRNLLGIKKVLGSINVNNNKLTSLIGSPKYVNYNFECSFNKLTSLKGAPLFIGGSFDCIFNQLTSLKYAPKSKSIICSNNSISTLKGLNTNLMNVLFCTNNKLNNLLHSPKRIENTFSVQNNQINSLKGAPVYVGNNFVCCDNKLETLKYTPNYIGNRLYCTNNEIKNLESLYEKDIKTFVIKSDHLTEDDINIFKNKYKDEKNIEPTFIYG